MAQITPVQIRAARALAGWTQQALADQSGVAVVTVKKLESGSVDARTSTLQAIENAFAKAGVHFIPQNSAGVKGEGVIRAA